MVSCRVLDILGKQAKPLANDNDSDAGHFRPDEVIAVVEDDKAESDRQEGAAETERPAMSATPKSQSAKQFCFPKKRKVATPSEVTRPLTDAQADTLAMRQKEHDLRMEVLRKEMQVHEAALYYWQQKARRESGQSFPAPEFSGQAYPEPQGHYTSLGQSYGGHQSF